MKVLRAFEGFFTKNLSRYKKPPKAILSALAPFAQAVKSITLDNGTEFADHKIIANRLNATVYFAHPHCPWERKFFPKIFVLVSKMANGH